MRPTESQPELIGRDSPEFSAAERDHQEERLYAQSRESPSRAAVEAIIAAQCRERRREREAGIEAACRPAVDLAARRRAASSAIEDRLRAEWDAIPQDRKDAMARSTRWAR